MRVKQHASARRAGADSKRAGCFVQELLVSWPSTNQKVVTLYFVSHYLFFHAFNSQTAALLALKVEIFNKT